MVTFLRQGLLQRLSGERLMIPEIPENIITSEELNNYFDRWVKIFPCKLPYRFQDGELLGMNIFKNFQVLLIAAMEKK